MTISIGSSTFSGTLHGTPNVPPWEFALPTQKFFGLRGEYQIFGETTGRTITIPYELTGFSTHVNLQAEIAIMAAAIGTTGTMTVDLGGGDSSSYPECTFLGWTPTEANPRKDGSGVNGWEQQGELKFRQKAN